MKPKERPIFTRNVDDRRDDSLEVTVIDGKHFGQFGGLHSVMAELLWVLDTLDDRVYSPHSFYSEETNHEGWKVYLIVRKLKE